MNSEKLLEINPMAVDAGWLEDQNPQVNFKIQFILETQLKLDSPRTRQAIKMTGYKDNDLVKRSKSAFKKEYESDSLTTLRYNLFMIQLAIRVKQIAKKRGQLVKQEQEENKMKHSSCASLRANISQYQPKPYQILYEEKLQRSKERSNDRLRQDFQRHLSYEFQKQVKMKMIVNSIEKASKNKETKLNEASKKARKFNLQTLRLQKKMAKQQEEMYEDILHRKQEELKKDQELEERLRKQQKDQEEFKYQKQKDFLMRKNKYVGKIQEYQERQEEDFQQKQLDQLAKEQRMEEFLKNERALLHQKYLQLQMKYQEYKQRAQDMVNNKEAEVLQEFFSSTLIKEQQLEESKKKIQADHQTKIRKNKKQWKQFLQHKLEVQQSYQFKLREIEHILYRKSQQGSRAIENRQSQSRSNIQKLQHTEASTDRIFSTEVDEYQTQGLMIRNRLRTQQENRQRQVEDILKSRLRNRIISDKFEEDFNSFFTTRQPKNLVNKLKAYELEDDETIVNFYMQSKTNLTDQ